MVIGFGAAVVLLAVCFVVWASHMYGVGVTPRAVARVAGTRSSPYRGRRFRLAR